MHRGSNILPREPWLLLSGRLRRVGKVAPYPETQNLGAYRCCHVNLGKRLLLDSGSIVISFIPTMYRSALFTVGIALASNVTKDVLNWAHDYNAGLSSDAPRVVCSFTEKTTRQRDILTELQPFGNSSQRGLNFFGLVATAAAVVPISDALFGGSNEEVAAVSDNQAELSRVTAKIAQLAEDNEAILYANDQALLAAQVRAIEDVRQLSSSIRDAFDDVYGYTDEKFFVQAQRALRNVPFLSTSSGLNRAVLLSMMGCDTLSDITPGAVIFNVSFVRETVATLADPSQRCIDIGLEYSQIYGHTYCPMWALPVHVSLYDLTISWSALAYLVPDPGVEELRFDFTFKGNAVSYGAGSVTFGGFGAFAPSLQFGSDFCSLATRYRLTNPCDYTPAGEASFEKAMGFFVSDNFDRPLLEGFNFKLEGQRPFLSGPGVTFSLMTRWDERTGFNVLTGYGEQTNGSGTPGYNTIQLGGFKFSTSFRPRTDIFRCGSANTNSICFCDEHKAVSVGGRWTQSDLPASEDPPIYPGPYSQYPCVNRTFPGVSELTKRTIRSTSRALVCPKAYGVVDVFVGGTPSDLRLEYRRPDEPLDSMACMPEAAALDSLETEVPLSFRNPTLDEARCALDGSMLTTCRVQAPAELLPTGELAVTSRSGLYEVARPVVALHEVRPVDLQLTAPTLFVPLIAELGVIEARAVANAANARAQDGINTEIFEQLGDLFASVGNGVADAFSIFDPSTWFDGILGWVSIAFVMGALALVAYFLIKSRGAAGVTVVTAGLLPKATAVPCSATIIKEFYNFTVPSCMSDSSSFSRQVETDQGIFSTGPLRAFEDEADLFGRPFANNSHHCGTFVGCNLISTTAYPEGCCTEISVHNADYMVFLTCVFYLLLLAWLILKTIYVMRSVGGIAMPSSSYKVIIVVGRAHELILGMLLSFIGCILTYLDEAWAPSFLLSGALLATYWWLFCSHAYFVWRGFLEYYHHSKPKRVEGFREYLDELLLKGHSYSDVFGQHELALLMKRFAMPQIAAALKTPMYKSWPIADLTMPSFEVGRVIGIIHMLVVIFAYFDRVASELSIITLSLYALACAYSAYERRDDRSSVASWHARFWLATLLSNAAFTHLPPICVQGSVVGLAVAIVGLMLVNTMSVKSGMYAAAVVSMVPLANAQNATSSMRVCHDCMVFVQNLTCQCDVQCVDRDDCCSPPPCPTLATAQVGWASYSDETQLMIAVLVGASLTLAVAAIVRGRKYLHRLLILLLPFLDVVTDAVVVFSWRVSYPFGFALGLTLLISARVINLITALWALRTAFENEDDYMDGSDFVDWSQDNPASVALSTALASLSPPLLTWSRSLAESRGLRDALSISALLSMPLMIAIDVLQIVRAVSNGITLAVGVSVSISGIFMIMGCFRRTMVATAARSSAKSGGHVPLKDVSVRPGGFIPPGSSFHHGKQPAHVGHKRQVKEKPERYVIPQKTGAVPNDISQGKTKVRGAVKALKGRWQRQAHGHFQHSSGIHFHSMKSVRDPEWTNVRGNLWRHRSGIEFTSREKKVSPNKVQRQGHTQHHEGHTHLPFTETNAPKRKRKKRKADVPATKRMQALRDAPPAGRKKQKRSVKKINLASPLLKSSMKKRSKPATSRRKSVSRQTRFANGTKPPPPPPDGFRGRRASKATSKRSKSVVRKNSRKKSARRYSR